MSFNGKRNTASKEEATSFINDINIDHGPVELIERYFKLSHEYLHQRGVVLRRVDPMDAVRLNRVNEASWWRQVPILDAEDFPPTWDELVAFIGYDVDGDAVTAMSVRYFDLGQATLKEEMESLRLFYGDRAELAHKGVDCAITSPGAKQITGAIAYMGGLLGTPESKRFRAVFRRPSHCTFYVTWYVGSGLRHVTHRAQILFPTEGGRSV